MVSRYLKREGYDVRAAGDGDAMRECMAAGHFDLVIMDLQLPGDDGLTLTRNLRAESDIPVIILTGKDDTIDRVVGLEVGADDYLGKPFDNRELLARVRSVMRRAGAPRGQAGSTNALVEFEGWRLDLDARELTAPDGERVELTTAEFRLLSGFVQNPRRVLNRDQLLDMVADRAWEPYDRSIDVLVGKLRRKIECDAKHPLLIKTVRGAGYMFAADVRRAVPSP